MPTIKARIGGAWVPVGGGGAGADEVWIGTDTPTDAATELWYDTDEPNLYEPDTARWNSAWGVVAFGSFVSSTIALPTTTKVQVTNTLPFTPVSGRRYRIIIGLRALAGGPAATSYFSVFLRDGSTDLAAQALPFQPSVGLFCTLYHTWNLTGGGARSLNVAITAGQASTAYADDVYNNSFYVEDVGPVSLASSPPAQPSSAWTNVTAFTNGWSNYGLPWAPVSYRLLGDKVELRGMIKGGTLNQAMFLLPAGFRPPYNQNFAAANNDAFGETRVYPDGTVMALSPTTNVWVDLSTIQFSVTP
jgi:hypothetical protein